MEDYPAGTLLTCAHEGCGCRLRVEEVCHCPNGGQAYRCTCGAEMVPVENPPGGG